MPPPGIPTIVLSEVETGDEWITALDLGKVLVSERNRQHWSWVASFDARRAAAGLRLPVLLVFGERDHLLPLPATVSAWTDSLARAGNADFSVRIFAGAGHDIRVGGQSHGVGGRWAPGYLDLLGDWITARGGSTD